MSSTSSSSSDSEQNNEYQKAMKEFISNEINNSRAELITRLYHVIPDICESSSSIGRRKRKYINRGRLEGYNRLYSDYFSDNPVYTDEQFRRRFRMRKSVFLRIIQTLQDYSQYFKQTRDAAGKLSTSPLQKCTAAIRMLAYGVADDALDDYLRMAECTIIQCVKNFVQGVIACFGDEYLRRPNQDDITRLPNVAEQRGFPGMLGSIDCMHWEWKNCPIAWQGMYTRGDHGSPTIMLEAITSYDTWIWHAFFGVPGSNNDINVLECSPLFDDVMEGRAPLTQYTVNGRNYDTGYYLTDGIYPEWSTFVKSISYPRGPKEQLFAKHQEGCRKDVERAFGVLQSRFSIVRGPARFWDQAMIGQIMRACIILHNMIVENEREDYNFNFQVPDYELGGNSDPAPHISRNHIAEYATYIRNNIRLRDRAKHRQLQMDLIEHVWQQFGSND